MNGKGKNIRKKVKSKKEREYEWKNEKRIKERMNKLKKWKMRIRKNKWMKNWKREKERMNEKMENGQNRRKEWMKK